MFLADILPLAVLSTDRQQAITYANTAAEALLKAKFTSLRGRKLGDYFDFPPAIARHVSDTLEYGMSLKAYDQTLSVKPLRDPVTAHLYLTPVWHGPVTGPGTGGPSPDGILLALDLLQTIEIVKEQQSHQEYARHISLMASMLAHEIKNPLSAIRSAAQLLEEEEQNKELSGLIIRESDRIKSTLEQVEFLNTAPGLRQEAINIHEVLRYVRTVLDPKITSRVQFEERYDPTIPEVSGNRDMLIQLFLNLIKNSAEAMEHTAQPVIKLSTSVNHAYRLRINGKNQLSIQVTVEDNGPGMPEDVKVNLFTPCVTTKKGGHGLGLMIAAKIATDHKGIIELADTYTGHTAFRVMFPCAI